jgi:hypothetical protein
MFMGAYYPRYRMAVARDCSWRAVRTGMHPTTIEAAPQLAVAGGWKLVLAIKPQFRDAGEDLSGVYEQ